MGKYKELKKEHDKLKASVERLTKALVDNGSISKPGIFPCYGVLFAGDHNIDIRCARVDANRALFRVKELEKFFGLKMCHTQIDEWEYIERTDTDE